MGNSRSQPCRRSRPMYLFYLIHRTWTGKSVEHVGKEDHDDTIDRESEFSSSRCSDCKNCNYRQNNLTFDSESEMAPNAEEELLAVKPWGPQPEKERLRPPTYNAEDYAIALRRWGRRPVVTSHESSHGTLPSTTSSSSGYASGSGEMTLRQFTSVSELLNKLRADLRLAFPSFVQEFASPPADGITLLLETLRGVQLIQSSPPSGTGGPRIGTRRAALDELGCVECLAACGERCPDAPRLLSQAQPGLLALAVCLTSSLNRSRVLALQLLTKVCQAPGGHSAVSEAVSTLRLRYGEGGRFRFLAGALLAPRAAIALRVAGISFLNAFLKSASRPQTRLYIQAEACEAGLEPRILQSWLTEVDGRNEEALTDLLHKEVQKWSHNCVDIEALQKRLARAEETCALLSNKVSILQGQLDKLHTEKMNSYNSNSSNNEENRKSKSKSKSATTIEKKISLHGVSSNAEDEGISSSERSSSPEEHDENTRKMEQPDINLIDNDQETTIDDVIEELRIIVKDAEEEYEDRKCVRDNTENTNEINSFGTAKRIDSRISVESPNNESHVEFDPRHDTVDGETRKNPITYFGRNDEMTSVDTAITRKLSSASSSRIGKTGNEDSVKIVVKSSDFEDAIIPAILYPQPPRRAPPCLSTIIATREGDFLDHQIVYNQHDDEDIEEEETLGDGSDSLLSASRLKYNTKNEINDSPRIACEHEAQNYYQMEKNVLETRNPRIAVTTNSREGKRDSRIIRNFDASTNMKNLQDTNLTTKYHEVYKHFEATSKTADCSSPVSKRETRYKGEMEMRKLHKRSTSHDLLDSNLSSPRSGKSTNSSNKIESRIRKFESLSAFENSSLQNFNRHEDHDIAPRRNQRFSRFVGGKTKIQRSESFHHVSMVEKVDQRHFTRGGSDSGLLYITDYDLEPLVTRTVREPSPRSENLLTKSLDKIDEGLDSMMIDGTILSGKRCHTLRSIKEKQGKSSKSRNDEKSSSNVKTGFGKIMTKKSIDKSLKNDELYNGIYRNSKLLRNDEFYDDGMRKGRQCNYQNEIDGFRKINDYPGNRNSMTIDTRQCHSRRESTNYERSKFSINDSGVFLPSGRYDAFGLGKNRFNAGKYSGNLQSSQETTGIKRNSATSLVVKRDKVTDILSGLY